MNGRLSIAGVTLVAILAGGGAQPERRDQVKISEVNIRVRILIDLSASMTVGVVFLSDVHEKLVEVVSKEIGRFAGSLEPGEEASVATFAHRIHLSGVWSREPQVLAAEFRALDQAGSPSPMFDATAEVLQDFEKRKLGGARSAIILLTDGFATGNILSRSDTVALARAGRVSVHVVRLSTHRIGARAGETNAQAEEMLRQFAEATGGSYQTCDLHRDHTDARSCLAPSLTGALNAVRKSAR